MELREQMLTLPDPPGPDDRSINVWNVREALLDTGRNAASALGAWRQALALNADRLQSAKQRSASAFEQARIKGSDNGPLIKLGRVEEARKLLLACRAVFERENAIAELGRVLSGLALLELTLDRQVTALHFEEAALRYHYVSADPRYIALSHYNLAVYLSSTDGDCRVVLAHCLASALIDSVVRSGTKVEGLTALAEDLRRDGQSARSALPADFATLCATVQQVEGVQFEELMGRLRADQTSGVELLQLVIAKAEELARASADADALSD
jgi:hypothetical protein